MNSFYILPDGFLCEEDERHLKKVLRLEIGDSIEALRAQANDLWNDHYSNDGATTSILAGSLWLEDGVPFNQDTLNTLAENYYASSFRGDLDSPAMTEVKRIICEHSCDREIFDLICRIVDDGIKEDEAFYYHYEQRKGSRT